MRAGKRKQGQCLGVPQREMSGEAFVPRWETLVKAGRGSGRAAPSGTVLHWWGFRDVLLWTTILDPTSVAVPIAGIDPSQ